MHNRSAGDWKFLSIIAAIDGCLFESGKNKAAERKERAPPFIRIFAL